MKRILILCRHDERHTYDQKDTFRTGMDGLNGAKAEYTTGEYEDLLFWFDGTELHLTLGGVSLDEFDTIFLIGWFKTKMLEDVALSVAKYAEARGIPLLNSEALYTRSRSKLSQYVVAALNDISMTPFLYSMRGQNLLQPVRDVWNQGYPVIVKNVQASRGNDNFLVGDEDELKTVLTQSNEEEGPWYVIQGFVPNDGDYRIIAMGDRVERIIHRKAVAGTHLSNTSQGGTATLVDLQDIPADIHDQVLRIAKLLRREITGVDMIRHQETGVYYFLEANNMPQLATGSYIDEKLTALDTYLASL